MAVTKDDYAKLVDLLTMTHTVTLDCEREPFTDEDDLFSDGDEKGLDTYLYFGGNEAFYGNMTCDHFSDLYGYGTPEYESALRKRFRTFVQEDGEIGMEISYLPGPPFINNEGKFEAGYLDALWNETRLSEVMTRDELEKDLLDGAEWVEECFGNSGECYSVMMEVTKAGRKSVLQGEFDDLIGEEPLWIQRKGKKYNVHIAEYSD